MTDLRLNLTEQILSWGEGNKIRLSSWGKMYQLNKPIDDEQITFLENNDLHTLKNFAALCHERVQDRDASFTLRKRIELYSKWLSTNQPCLMAITSGKHRLINASIVLPLTAAAYEMFCSKGLDALDIQSQHFLQFDSKEPFRYLLVDMLTTNSNLLKNLPKDEQKRLKGIGFRAVLYHLSKFINMNHQLPVILCSTANRPLARLLSILNFDKLCKQVEKNSIYEVDLSRLDSYPSDVRMALTFIIVLARFYKKVANINPDKVPS